MNKKLLISLSSLATIATIAPVLVITSCSGETPAIVNLTITAKIDPKLTQEDITALEGSELPAEFAALQKLFTGKDLTTVNQANFKVAVDKTKQIVTLTANTGFTINDKSTLESNKYEILPIVETENLSITATPDVVLTNDEVTLLEGSDNAKKWPVLEKLFTGSDFVPTNIDNKFTVSFNKSNLEVTLTAKTGFAIDGNQTLSNKFTVDQPITPTNLVLTANATPTLTETEVTILERPDNDNNKLAALQKLFTGKDLTIENLGNFDILVNKQAKKVTLTAKANYTINDGKTLESNTYTIDATPTEDLKITANDAQILTTGENTDIKGTDTSKQLPVLQKLFIGVTSTNQVNFKVAVSETNVVTLTANSGFSFSGQQILVAPAYTVETPPADKNLIITAIASPSLKESDITDLQGSNNDSKLTALKKLFSGTDLTNSSLANFDVSVNTTNKKVTLTAKQGFIISGGKTLESNEYKLEPTLPTVINLNITARAAARVAISDIPDLQGNDDNKKFAVLQKLFQGSDLSLANLNKFTISVNTSQRIVTLTPIENHTINNAAKLDSNVYTINLAITPKRGNLTITPTEVLDLDYVNPSKHLGILQKLFDGADLTSANLDKFTIGIIRQGLHPDIYLYAKTGYTFSGSATRNKYASMTEIVNANITPKNGTVSFTPTEINKLKEVTSSANQADQLQLLQRAFNLVSATNQRFFRIEVNEKDKIITLQTIPGFVFGAINTSQNITESKTYTS
ncbi:MAG: hypothetical protein ACRC9U_02225 [Metamycoplasmataceae bacterium]